MTTVKIEEEKFINKNQEIHDWLTENAGIGSERFSGKEGNISHWLNGDDWLYYIETIREVTQYGLNPPELQSEEYWYVFKFRNAEVATEFALRFS